MTRAFLSYSHNDNQGLYEGWVEKFAEHLDMLLRGKLRTRARVLLRDTDTTTSQTLRPQIRELLDQARAMICLVSGHYLPSGWCPAEVDYWVQDRSGVDKLYRIDIPPTARSEHMPAALSGRKGTEFFDAHGVRLRHDLVETRHAYERRLACLAADIAAQLQQTEDVLNAAAWVAPTGEGAALLAHSLAASLRSRGHLTMTSLGNPPPFRAARVAVFVVDGTTRGGDDTAIRDRMAEARDGAEKGDLLAIVWVPPNAVASDLAEWLNENLVDSGPLLIAYGDDQISLEHMLNEKLRQTPGPPMSQNRPPVLLVEQRGSSRVLADGLARALEPATGPLRRLRLEGDSARAEVFASAATGTRAVILAATDLGKTRPVATVLNQWLATGGRAPSDRWIWFADDAMIAVPPVVEPWRGVAGPATSAALEILENLVAA